MLYFLGKVALGGVVSIAGLMTYSHYCNSQSTSNQAMEKRDLNRYTLKELEKVVGRTPPSEWTYDQTEKLDQMFLKRQEKCYQRWAELNKEMEKDKLEHPEKYQGLMKLIHYGPDPFEGNWYDCFKVLDKDEVSDD